MGEQENSHVFNEKNNKYSGIVDTTDDLFSLLFRQILKLEIKITGMNWHDLGGHIIMGGVVSLKTIE